MEQYRRQSKVVREPSGAPEPGAEERAFHQLSKDEQATIEKKRLSEYCRRSYKKVHITQMEERSTTIYRREYSFYVDTVCAFCDRRYEYKALNKNVKKQLSRGQASGGVSAIKSVNSRVAWLGLARAGLQVHPKLILRIRHAQRSSLAQYGVGRRCVLHWRRPHHARQRDH